MTVFDELWGLLGAENVSPKTVDMRSLQTKADALIARASDLTDAERAILLSTIHRLTNDNE